MSLLLISTYDLGRQPFGLASAAAWLRRAGCEVVTRDLSREPLADGDVARADLVAFYVPMHTATRLALPVIDRIHAARPDLPLIAFGLYAPLNEALLREHGVSFVIGPEAEADLVDVMRAGLKTGPYGIVRSGRSLDRPMPDRPMPRLNFITPDRANLPALSHYATLKMPDGSARVAGATDATRGCKHRCRHCPIVPVYDGQFRVVPLEVELADIDQQVAGGAEHITFGDPDFFNGPAHARRIVERLHARHPHVTYDVTIKIEHLLKHRDLLPLLAATACLFLTSAVEALDDGVLAKLEKHHTRADFEAAVGLTRAAGLALVPTFLAFTPWTTRDSYRDLLDTVERLGLVEHVAPVQWGLRLLVTQGSRLLELDEIRARIGPFDPRSLTYPWRHDDPRIDALQRRIMAMIGVRGARSRAAIFHEVRLLAGAADAKDGPRQARAAIPYLDEPWYC